MGKEDKVIGVLKDVRERFDVTDEDWSEELNAIDQAISMIKENGELRKELDQDLYPYSHGCDKHDYQWQDNRKEHIDSKGCYACLKQELTELKAMYEASCKNRVKDKAKYEELESKHCKDCCCAESWKALGITEYTGKSIPEHIADLKKTYCYREVLELRGKCEDLKKAVETILARFPEKKDNSMYGRGTEDEWCTIEGYNQAIEECRKAVRGEK